MTNAHTRPPSDRLSVIERNCSAADAGSDTNRPIGIATTASVT
jgi:hypothetical protein